MPNKPHPPRNKPGKSSASASGINGEDTSFIVFGDGKSSKKKTTKPTSSPAVAEPSSSSKTSSSSKSKKGTTDTPTEPDPSAPKKPDTRTLIGGASWTGKLPLNLLNEHCQRAKWEKPEYTMSRSSAPPGFYSHVILRNKNAKTGEVTTLPPIQLPRERQEIGVRETAVEARHFAAAWALFRISSGKNLSMALPPQYRDLWRGEFAEIKKGEVERGSGWAYESDPFAARVRHEEEKRTKEKERAEREERREKERKDREERSGVGGGKGWGRAPKVDMGKRMRREVEALVRSGTVWNSHGVRMEKKQKDQAVQELASAGFRRAHVQEAVEECKDKEETLEWLMIHVPEDDLPKWCLPENYTAGVSLASGDMVRENKVKRLAAAGYAAELCSEVLATSGEDEAVAAESLQKQLLDSTDSETDANHAETNNDAEFWKDELAVLESIYGDRFERTGKDICRVKLEIDGNSHGPVALFARRPRSGYPYSPPIISVEATLPAYIRLSIIKRSIQDGLADLLGEQMIFSLVDWLEQNIPSIIESPGSLKSISRAVGLPSEAESRSKRQAPRGPRHQIPVRPSPQAGAQLFSEWQARQSTAQQKKMIEGRQKLPAWNLRDEVVRAVNASQVTIISGETGSGKSTQSVQFILDDMIQRKLGAVANVVCTQPRRISALGLADRVADERCSPVGHEVGYSIRGESRQKPGLTKITFVTTGVLLRRLQTTGGDPKGVVAALDGISHVVIDEVHERSLDTDFLMSLLRDVLKSRKDLKLILMSATLDADLFEKYFSSSASVSKVEIEGRTHPVTDVYLEQILDMTGFVSQARNSRDDEDEPTDASIGAALRAVGTRINYDLIAMTVDYIDQDLNRRGDTDSGAILIFLPGVAEIDRTLTAIRRLSAKFHALPLHASLQPSEQRKVFPRAGSGKRKVIAATNVAETSITIEDVVAVIDTGKVKETSFDPIAGMVRLAEVWASKAACKQRRGRAGRVTAGTCYKLFTRNLEATKMAERPEPEIKRVPLEQLCLSVKAMGLEDVQSFLRKAITPPETLAIQTALTILDRMGILDSGTLTALGRHLALIPADLRCGKLLVVGATFSCLESCLTIASILSVKSPFVSPQDKRQEANTARAAFHDGSGDLICDLRAYQQWAARRADGEPMGMLRAWCGQNFLSPQTLQDIANNRTQYLSTLKDIQFVPFDYSVGTTSYKQCNKHENNMALLRALVAASFTPQIARIEFPDAKYIASVSGSVAMDPEARTIKFFTKTTDMDRPTNERVFIHPSSALFSAQTFPTNTAFMSYFTKMATSKIFVRDLTPCNAYSLLLFCGSLTLAAQNGGGLLVDQWIRIRGWARIGVLVSRLRAMLDDLLEKKLDDPSMEIGGRQVVNVVRKLIELDGMDN
ncbi:putative ATP-dependent RNA helicase ucp12 [Elsinoe australis]|uniref:Putative ATP-dependent RNA helicase ucp12 n=1 Tax=Elsinoe australis TaxID=40998 RepID=A0A4U7AXW9_9PEZI|nr:putative ATP-dependent RNA helicase ucp12 [Elsinoe australis]